MSSTINSIITSRNRDCLGCRIVSGSGLIGSGLYISHHSRKLQNGKGKTAMYTIGSALVFLGTARIMDLPPFQNQFNQR